MPDFLDQVINFDGFDWLTQLLHGFLIYLAILWIAIVIWVARDVVNRSRNIPFQVGMILLVILLNIFGLLVYLIVRPQKTLAEKFYEDLEAKALADEESCSRCGTALPLSFQFCPGCGLEVRRKCKKCGKLVSKGWQACPYCGTAKKDDSKNAESKKDSKKN